MIESRLTTSSLTVREVAKLIYASETGLAPYFKMLHQTGQIHIVGYAREFKTKYESKLPIWKWGAGEDVPKPAPKTPLGCYHERRERELLGKFRE